MLNVFVYNVEYGDPEFVITTPDIGLPPVGALYHEWLMPAPFGPDALRVNEPGPQSETSSVTDGGEGIEFTETEIVPEVAKLGVAHTPLFNVTSQ